ncbi:MAG: magnesium chelatase subunit D family protein [Actinobacteria bacterium]|nr:magnesium chelatase subunit D family protein [Actinomycetota bacterium]
MGREYFLYPFSALVGQDRLKRALLVNAVDPRIGGLLIRGERGTGKSTAARALADLLPPIDVVADCPFSCNPHSEEEMCDECLSRWSRGEPLPVVTRPMRFVTLPLNASEDRVVGTLDLEKALKEGVKEFEPGILAEANRALLYVDEVNLLEDHIVDLLLDAAAMGVNVVEREGVSFSHPASFIMVGTMNPEEGELRPQLEDRFGLCVEVAGERDTGARVEVMRRRRLFLEDPRLLQARFHPLQEELRRRILRARSLLPEVEVPDAVLELIARVCVELGAGGHRADIATCQAARALAALDGKACVDRDDVREAAEMALPHRLRRSPLDGQIKDMERLERIIMREGRSLDLPLQEPCEAAPLPREAVPSQEESEREPSAPAAERPPGPEAPEVEVPPLQPLAAKKILTANGRRNSAVTDEGNGKRIGHRVLRPDETPKAGNLALEATLRAAAGRSLGKEQPLAIQREDLRAAIKRRRAGSLILFILDASASMGCAERIEATKQVVRRLLTDAYQKRDRVGLITFRDESAQLVLNPTSSIQLANLRIKDLATGGATPLNHGLAMGLLVARRELRRDPDLFPLLVLITDGHGNVGLASGDPVREGLEIAGRIREEGLHGVVFDTSNPRFILGRNAATQARRIADAMGAAYYHLSTLQPEEMLDRLGTHL